MKKIILLVLTALMMTGCESSPYDTSKSIEFNTIVIDSCEYIYGYQRLAHKGNCKYCKEHRKQELKELVEQLKLK